MTLIEKHGKDMLFWVLFFSLAIIDRVVHDATIKLVLNLVIVTCLLIIGFQTVKRDIKHIYKNREKEPPQ